MLRSIAYVSSVTRGLTADEIDSILQDAREFNAERDISGVLLFSGLEFFQLLEGSPDALDAVMDRINIAKAHSNIRILFDGEAAERHFATWHMGLINAPGTEIQQLADAEWRSNLPTERTSADMSQGLQLVSLYWSKWLAGMR